MKRFLFPLLFALFFTACSSEPEDNPGSPVTPQPQPEVEADFRIKNAVELMNFLENQAEAVSDTQTVAILADIDMAGKEAVQVESFRGILDGRGHSIKNWETKNPLFKKLYGEIRNVVIDKSCHLGVNASGLKAFLVGENMGVVKNCTNNGEVNMLIKGTTTAAWYLGSLVSWSKPNEDSTKAGVVVGCVNNGPITGQLAGMNKAFQVGGVCGRMEGIVGQTLMENCRNKGNISIEVTNSEQVLCFGGLSGSMSNGIVSGCANEADLALTVTEETSGGYTASGGISGYIKGNPSFNSCSNSGTLAIIVDKSAKVRSYAGGIVGDCIDGSYVTLDGCSNLASADVNVSIRQACCVGGVAGQFIGRMTGCSNKARVTMANANDKSEVGGLCGNSQGDIISCHSEGDVICDYKGNIKNEAGTVAGAVLTSSTISGCRIRCKVSTEGKAVAGYVIGGTRTSSPTVTVGAAGAPVIIEASTCINEHPVSPDDLTKQSSLSGALYEGAVLDIVNVQMEGTYSVVDGFPASWTNHSAQSTEWESTSRLKSNDYGDGTMSVVSVNGKALSCKSGANAGVSGHNNMDICVNNLSTGDYFLFKIPAHSIDSGAEVQFSINLQSRGNGAPKYWLFEYFDGGKWKSISDSYGTTKTLGDGTKYSFYILPYAEDDQFTNFIGVFNLSEAIRDSYLQMRVKAVGSENAGGGVLVADERSFTCLPASHYVAAQVQVFGSDSPSVRDTKKLGALGNSFTYYFETPMMLQRIARSQGHRLISRVNHKGSQSFSDHLVLDLSRTVMEEGGYDVFLIQDVSTKEGILGDDDTCESALTTLSDGKSLSERVKQYSPSAKLLVEQTWAYIYPHSTGKYDNPYLGFGSYDAMDAKILEGCRRLKAHCPCIDGISPIGAGFAGYRALYPEFYPSGGSVKDKVKSLYINNNDSTDNQHANINGAYMKSCINYLTIYGEPFTGTVDDCGVAPAVAEKIREIAVSVVFGKQ